MIHIVGTISLLGTLRSPLVIRQPAVAWHLYHATKSRSPHFPWQSAWWGV